MSNLSLPLYVVHFERAYVRKRIIKVTILNAILFWMTTKRSERIQQIASEHLVCGESDSLRR